MGEVESTLIVSIYLGVDVLKRSRCAKEYRDARAVRNRARLDDIEAIFATMAKGERQALS